MFITLAVLGCVGLAVFAFVWYTRKVWFFRDPDHSQTSQSNTDLRSPVYGKIAYIRRIEGGHVQSEKKGETIAVTDITKDDWPPGTPPGEGWLIGIAMTALDVHYQYSPLPARVGSIHHFQHGRNLPMFDLWEYVKITWLRRAVQLISKKYILENERQTMWLQNESVTLALVLIADKFVDKITTFVREGETVRAGGKLSFIGRGSQVDVVVCGHPGLRVVVKEGDAAHGPLTVLAQLDETEAERTTSGALEAATR
jgi:phosphatidylserine decarboxylase